jgi:pyruvate formate lyase activating enzyme
MGEASAGSLTHPALVEPAGGGAVRCGVCIRRCVIQPGRVGFCGTRRLEAVGLVSLAYGQVSTISLAEVEHKPLFHFYPGRAMLSVGSVGCNFRCPGCQNWAIAHAQADRPIGGVQRIRPQRLVELAAAQKCIGLSFTYNEPGVWFEYTLAASRLAKSRELTTNYVTNGSLSREALDLIGPYLDAWRVDIKGFSARTYDRLAGLRRFGRILANTQRAKDRWSMHVECVTNVIPGVNDAPEELAGIAGWIARRLGPDTPWHVTRFVPQFPNTGTGPADRPGGRAEVRIRGQRAWPLGTEHVLSVVPGAAD